MKVLVEPIKSAVHDRIRLEIVRVLWIIVGCMIPVWIYLSMVYRSPLPFEHIQSLSNFGLTTRITIHLALEGSKLKGAESDILKAAQSKFDSNLKGAGRVVLTASIVADSSSSTFSSRPGSYQIQVKCSPSSPSDGVVVQSDRVARLTLKKCDSDYAVKSLSLLLSDLFIPEFNSLQSKMQPSDSQSEIAVLKYSSEYQMSFTLLVGDPNDSIVSWDIESALPTLFPLFRQFGNISSFVVSSQIQNYATLHLSPPLSTINDKPMYSLSPKDLTRFINSAEWNLESSVSTSPAIHFLLYIPPKSTTPLQILHSDGSILDTNAFLIPQWGGIVVHNIDFTSPETHLSSTDLHPVMEVYADQLRQLMGVSPVSLSHFDDVHVEDSPLSGVSGWELDRLYRVKSIQNTADTISTLTSLASLLSSLETIVVRDHITQLVDASLRCLEETRGLLESDEVGGAAVQARRAIVLAEQAFFDPTMVSLLYFPAQHLLAIYMPFFVPIAVPMLSALVKEFKIWKAGRGRKVKKE